MPDPNPEESTDHDVIPAPNLNWGIIGFGLFSLLILGMIAQGNTLAVIAICALTAVALLAFR